MKKGALPYMIEVNGLVKRYGDKCAVNNISFTIKEGEIVGFLGPNGAGKSTTMNILTGYISSTEGTAKIDGIDILEDPIGAKRKIGYLPELPPLYLDMTVNEQLDFAYNLKGLKSTKEAKKEHIDKICALVKITDVQGRMIKNLSKGYKQRVGLAQALMGNPEVLILDEPTVGLDPKQIIEIRNLIGELGKTHTIILSSHILPEISAVCERVLVLNKGTIVADDKPENLSKALMGDRRMVLRAEGDRAVLEEAIKNLDGVDTCVSKDTEEESVTEFHIETEQDKDIRRALFAAVVEKGGVILMLKPLEMTLEDIFLQLTKDSEPQCAQQTEKPAQSMLETLTAQSDDEQQQRESEAEETAQKYSAPVVEQPSGDSVRDMLTAQADDEQHQREAEAEEDAHKYVAPITEPAEEKEDVQ